MKRTVIILILMTSLCVVSLAQNTVSTFFMLNALRNAYPASVTDIDYNIDEGGWYIIVNGIKLMWAEGRLLVPSQLHLISQYKPFIAYHYPKNAKDPSSFSETEIMHLTELGSSQSRAESEINPETFLNAVYDGETRRSIEQHIRKTRFLGYQVNVHEQIIPILERVSNKITAIAVNDEQVQSFIKNISRIEGFNWREIQDTSSRSMHSWGISIDILPIGWGNKIMYWQWESVNNKKWMLTPLSKRWSPPPAVIDVFESEGFIWGGKWDLWDNMHFEYRPELFYVQDE